MTARFYKLTELHEKLDEAVRREINRRAPDQFKVMALKRRKLRVRDLLARLTPTGRQGIPNT
ncbi:hypothetical protein GCM10023208_19010 [Erythrobacter westpacificensis]|uniref:DUF465 domain-containing protein n=1 Tax=Erythrobacter westpacificensis TaxID=1055231 RepID=A0ABP9KBC4_9SPHN